MAWLYDRVCKGHGAAHVAWVIFVLFILLVASLSSSLGTNPQISNILNFGIGLTSFIVGIFAIFQSTINSLSAERTKEDTRVALSAISEPVNQLASSVVELRSVTEKIHEKTDLVSQRLSSMQSFATQQSNEHVPVVAENDEADDRTVGKSSSNYVLNSIMQQGSTIARATLLTMANALDRLNPEIGDRISLPVAHLDDEQRAKFSASVSMLLSTGAIEGNFSAEGFVLEYDEAAQLIRYNKDRFAHIDEKKLVHTLAENFTSVSSNAKIHVDS